jgi:radical SAM-linked protein
MFVHHTNLAEAEGDHRKLVCYDCGVACDLTAMRGERLVALRKLGAETPRAAPPPREARPRGVKAPASFEQGEARRYRFVYTKLGASAFLSHLDVIRALPRAFRRLGVPLYYSRGFHPKPDMSFGPALSLGVSSLCEAVDVKITQDLDPREILRGLTEGAHAGTEFLGGVRLGARDPAITRVVDAARYVVAIPRVVLDACGGDAWLDERIGEVLRAEELSVVRRIDGIGKKIDVKRFLRGVARGGERAKNDVARAGIVGDLVEIEIEVAITGSGAVKVSEVVEVIAGAHAEDFACRAVRVAMGKASNGDIVSPLVIEAESCSVDVELCSTGAE